MNDRLVTVFGGSGFVGRYVVQALLAKGARVRLAERDPRKAFFLKPQGGLGQTQFVAADIKRPDTVARAVSGADAVVNMVGVLSGDMYGHHVTGARNVAEAAQAAGASQLIQVSAIGADAASPSTYGRSKGEGEARVLEAFPNATIVRPSIVFGPEDAFTNRFAAMIASAPLVPVLRGATKFQPVFVGDVGEAVARVLAGGAPADARIVELGGPDILSMGEIYRWLAKTIERDPSFIDVPDAAGALLARIPGVPITRDQWLMLQHDNVVAPGAMGFAELGITPTPMAAVAPDWLVRYRRNGRFNRRAEGLAA